MRYSIWSQRVTVDYDQRRLRVFDLRPLWSTGLHADVVYPLSLDASIEEEEVKLSPQPDYTAYIEETRHVTFSNAPRTKHLQSYFVMSTT